MTTIIANDIPPAARGLLRRWFIEPKPNVFVGSVNARTREKTLNYIRRNAPGLAMLVIFDEKNSQGFTVLSYGETDRAIVRKCGLELIRENPDESDRNERRDDNT
jgi:CRISPR-associated protein Cas2